MVSARESGPVNTRNGDAVQIVVPSKAEYVRIVRKSIAEFAESLCMPRSAVEDLEVAISEAVSNIVRHAYKGCVGARPVKVKCTHRKRRLVIDVIDRGCGFEAPPDNVAPDISFDKEGGLGIILIKLLITVSHNYSDVYLLI